MLSRLIFIILLSGIQWFISFSVSIVAQKINYDMLIYRGLPLPYLIYGAALPKPPNYEVNSIYQYNYVNLIIDIVIWVIISNLIIKLFLKIKEKRNKKQVIKV